MRCLIFAQRNLRAAAMLEYIAFLSCLEFAILNSLYQETILKPRQVLCLESVYLQKDVLCVLPTGYGKSLIFHVLPMLLFAKVKIKTHGNLQYGWRSMSLTTVVVNSIVIVVSPLNSLMADQISRLTKSGIRASVMSVKGSTTDQTNSVTDQTMPVDDCGDEEPVEDVNIDFSLCEERKLRDGVYHLVFSHPETISCKYGRELLLSEKYQENVRAIVVDEVHCIVDW